MKQSSRCGRFLALFSTLKHSIWSHACGDPKPIPIEHEWGTQTCSHWVWMGNTNPPPRHSQEHYQHFGGVPFSDLSLLFGALSSSSHCFICPLISGFLLTTAPRFHTKPCLTFIVSHIKGSICIYTNPWHTLRSLAIHCVHSVLVNSIRPSGLRMGMLPLIGMRLRMSILTRAGWDQKSLSQTT